MSKNKNRLIPKLRFPEFKDCGEWEEKTLEKVATFSKGKGISKSDIIETGILPCIRYGELYTHYKEIISKIISYTNVPADNLVLSQVNDVIIPSSGETQEDIATASCVMKDGVALGGDLNIIRTKVNGIFLAYYLNCAKKKDISQIAQGISVVHLYSSQLKKLIINVPRLKEQQKIASCLSSLDELIEAHSQKLELLKQHKKGLMQNLFPQEGEKVPKLRFKKFENCGEWKELFGNKLFKSISNKKHNSDLPILAITQEYGAIPRELIDYTVIVSQKSIKNYKVVEKGDFIISLRSFQGGIEYSEYKGICSPAYIILRKKKNIDEMFFKYYFKTKLYIRQLNKNLEGIRDGKMVSYKQFSEILLPHPSLQEQQKIASCLSSLDDLITAQTEKIEQLKQHKKGLMQGLFPITN